MIYGVHIMSPKTKANFTNDYSILIQIWWKINFSVTPLQGTIISLQNFAHGMTAQLWCHVQNFIVITTKNLDDSIMKFP